MAKNEDTSFDPNRTDVFALEVVRQDMARVYGETVRRQQQSQPQPAPQADPDELPAFLRRQAD